MAEKARTVPGARGRGPKPKLEHPMPVSYTHLTLPTKA